MDKSFPVAATLRLRNGHLFRLLQTKGWTQHDLAQSLGVRDIDVSKWMRFVTRPRDPSIQRAIMELTGVAIDDVFPDRLYTGLPRGPVDTTIVRDIPLGVLIGYRHHPLALPSSEDLLLEQEARNNLEKALQTLSPKEQDILRRHFGLDETPQTLEDIGKRYNVGKDRIRMIEANALHKLRHPSRMHALRHALQGT